MRKIVLISAACIVLAGVVATAVSITATASTTPECIYESAEQDYVKVRCTNCGGAGRVFSGYYDQWGQPIPAICPACGGNGYIIQQVQPSPSFQASPTYYDVWDKSRYCYQSREKDEYFITTKTNRIINSVDKCNRCGHQYRNHYK